MISLRLHASTSVVGTASGGGGGGGTAETQRPDGEGPPDVAKRPWIMPCDGESTSKRPFHPPPGRGQEATLQPAPRAGGEKVQAAVSCPFQATSLFAKTPLTYAHVWEASPLHARKARGAENPADAVTQRPPRVTVEPPTDQPVCKGSDALQIA
jgi:hypothetical protein